MSVVAPPPIPSRIRREALVKLCPSCSLFMIYYLLIEVCSTIDLIDHCLLDFFALLDVAERVLSRRQDSTPW
jgi:hypothetical protein